jgi:ligand-binding sensor domain-containing protein
MADECRKHLGITTTPDQGRFELGKSMAHTYSKFAFAPDGDTAWVAVRNALYFCDPNNVTRKTYLPLTGKVDVTCMAMESGKLWIGTEGEGLVEYDIATGQCQLFTENDGLALNSISCLYLRKDSLWIGYGNGSQATYFQWGGLGLMNLNTHRFSAFSPPLRSSDEPSTRHYDIQLQGPITLVRAPNGQMVPNAASQARLDSQIAAARNAIMPKGDPPRKKVMEITEGAPGELLMAVWDTGVMRLNIDNNSWATMSTPDTLNRMSSLAFSPQKMLAGCSDPAIYPNMKGGTGFGLHVYLMDEKRWQRMAFQENLPGNDITALAFDGSNAWIGGIGFVAVVDLNHDKIRKVCYLDSKVEGLCIKDGNAWIRTSYRLYREPLSMIR